jgi:hypothetical protein
MSSPKESRWRKSFGNSSFARQERVEGRLFARITGLGSFVLVEVFLTLGGRISCRFSDRRFVLLPRGSLK